MTATRSEFLNVLTERGFIHQVTDETALDAHARAGRVTGYIGFDMTADSLHVGSLLQIMVLRWMQKTGHRPIALMGGGTTKIGDPSGKDDVRKLLSHAEIDQNMAGIKRIFNRFLHFGDGPADAIMANNADWLDELKYIPLLRDVGRHFSVNRMLSMDSVKLRLEREQPLTFLEFNYMVLQAYDFVELARRYDCILQMGGSDQWGNIVMGVDLGRRVAEKELFGLTTPLIATSSGAKMGKTAQGAVWLTADRVSPYDYFQFWRNTEDADVGRFLKLFTEMPMAEVARLETLQGAEINDAKKILAFEATKLCHGDAAAQEAADTAKRTFEQGASAEGLPTIEVTRADLERGIPALELFKMAKLTASNGETRRLVAQSGVSINDQVVSDAAKSVNLADLGANGVIKLSRGKKQHALVRAV
jgi:tyrosyl-tRNA synthetase